MAQQTFSGAGPGDAADLDANFTENYALREVVTTPAHGSFSAYTGSNAKLTFDSSWNLGVGTASPRGLLDLNSTRGVKVFLGTHSTIGETSQNAGSCFANSMYVSAESGGVMTYTKTNANAGGAVLIDYSRGITFYTGAAGSAAATGTLSTYLRLTIGPTSGNVTPGADNAQTFGSGALRWSTLYAGTGTINTSDAREKTAVSPMTSAEVGAAKQLAGEIGTYRFLAAIAAKGDDARTHVGMTVQRAIEVMESHGLDPMKYGFICYDEWEGGDRYAFRPDELMFFLARGFDARLSALESA